MFVFEAPSGGWGEKCENKLLTEFINLILLGSNIYSPG